MVIGLTNLVKVLDYFEFQIKALSSKHVVCYICLHILILCIKHLLCTEAIVPPGESYVAQ